MLTFNGWVMKKGNKQINRLAGIRLLGKLMFVDFKRQM